MVFQTWVQDNIHRPCTFLLSVCLSVHCPLSYCYVLHSLNVTAPGGDLQPQPSLCHTMRLSSEGLLEFPTFLSLQSCTTVLPAPGQDLISRSYAWATFLP